MKQSREMEKKHEFVKTKDLFQYFGYRIVTKSIFLKSRINDELDDSFIIAS